MPSVDALKEILDRLSSNDGISISGIVSRNGIPIVCNLPASSQADTFSTLSATIMGAGEVVFSGVGKQKPSMVILSAQGTNFVCTPISAKSLLVLMGDKNLEDMMGVVEKTKDEIKEVLSNGKV
ncbi:MAG: roadblock/LC7 domain-containing protein [Thermoplasmata archaeon]|nr:roadblock/LC7 domain-containing protein [Thermoplasmata archaeon]